MGLHHPFGHLKHKLWLKEGPKVKLASWLSTTKSWESTRFPCVKVVCDIPLKSSRRGLQLCFRPHPKITKVLTLTILRLSLGSLGTKNHLDVGFVDRHRIYYKGEGDGFPQVRVMVSFVSLNCPWFVLAPKVLQVYINHLMLVVCRSVWVVDGFHHS